MIGRIYKITSNQTNKVYYGSTIQTLSQRFNDHKKTSRNGICSSRELMCYDDAIIELIEEIEFDDKKQLKQVERYYIENNECVNVQVPLQTLKEYQIKNRDMILKKRKEDYIKNRDKYLQIKKQYYIDNKIVLDEKHRQWKLKNPEYYKLLYHLKQK
jgi:hypothetical protein